MIDKRKQKGNGVTSWDLELLGHVGLDGLCCSLARALAPQRDLLLLVVAPILKKKKKKEGRRERRRRKKEKERRRKKKEEEMK